MKFQFRSSLIPVGLFLIAILGAGLPGALPIIQADQEAVAPIPSNLHDLFPPVGPPSLPLIPSFPLVPVPMPSRTGGQIIPAALPSGSETGVGVLFSPLMKGALAMPAAQGCSSVTVDLQLLVIVAEPTDTSTSLPAIRQVLDYQGTPYTVFMASPRPSDPAANRLSGLLSSGCSGHFQGVILGNGQAAYSDPSAGWQSALTDAEWQALWDYERTFGIRQVTWYTYPSAEYGFNPPTSSGDTTADPIQASYTSAGQETFSYANTTNPLTIQYVWAYRATPLDSNTSPLLDDGSGHALGAIRIYPDGTQNLALTFDSNANVTHNLVLAYGVVNWVTGGLFVGERHIFLTPQVDDIFLDSHVWVEGTPCGSNTEQNNELYRMTGDDLQAVIDWQQAVRGQPTSAAFWLDMVFNGEGTSGLFNPDTLTPVAQANESQFKWTNHTYTHDNLDSASYDKMQTEINQNNQTAQDLGLATYSPLNLVTPDVSGLDNPDAMQAAFDAGVRYLVSDSSRPGYGNPSPNVGLYNQHQPGIFMIPRYPNNLFYNVTTPPQWVEEYNCIYRSFWGRDLTYPEILDNESQVLLKYVLTGDMNPWMFHETNLRAYDGSHTLLTDLTDRVLAKYNALLSLPILSPTMDELGGRMQAGTTYRAAGVTASIVPGESITLTSQQDAVVPVTGLNTAGAEVYGGQSISYISLSAGQSVTLPLDGTPPPTPTPIPTSTPAPTATPTPAPTSTPTPGNRAPVANDDSYTMRLLDVALIVSVPGVLGNDTDADGNPLTAVLVVGPSKGVLILNADGSFTYTPLASLTSFTDSFTYKAYDGTVYSNVATVTIRVNVP